MSDVVALCKGLEDIDRSCAAPRLVLWESTVHAVLRISAGANVKLFFATSLRHDDGVHRPAFPRREWQRHEVADGRGLG